MQIQYVPPGLVTSRFIKSDAFVSGIKGPVGSGKSTACCIKILTRALAQYRGNDGYARSRVVIVRNTFPELKSTTIKTWLEWFPEEHFGKIKWDSPITQVLDLGDKRVLEAMFLALDRPEDVKKLLSLDTSWVWLNEVKELPKAVLDAATGRAGRYPYPKSGAACYKPAVFMDTNPPPDDHWWYKLAVIETPDGFEFFDQPGGMHEDAENLDWLNQSQETLLMPLGSAARRKQGRGYYERLIAGKADSWVKVYVHGEYGSTSSDRAIHPEYRDQIHRAKDPIPFNKSLPLYLGVDFGLTPACVIAQASPSGQLRILNELTSENMGLVQFIENKVKPLLASEYPGAKIISLHDPAGVQRSQTNEVTCRQVLREHGLNPSTVSTNSFVSRKEAVSFFLTRLIDGEPAIIISPKCRMLNKGLNGDYKFKRINVPGEERFKDVPDKTIASHVCEALQYLCLHFHTPGRAQNKRALRPLKTATKYARAGY